MNGNDLLEYEENNYSELYEGFIKEYPEKYESFMKANKHEEELEEKFVEYMGDLWIDYVLDDYNITQATIGDRLADEAREK